MGEVVEIVIRYLIPLLLGYLINYIKNIRKKDNSQNEAIKCLLRSNMLNQYYVYKGIGKMPLYVKESWYYMYKAYKMLNGNSFVDNLKDEIDQMAIEK